MEKQGKQWQTIFLGSKVTADGDYSHEIKRSLLLGSKAMTYLDSILKSKDITLPTNVYLMKALVCPVVMYGCESWTIMRAECHNIDAFELWCWRRLLTVLWTARRSHDWATELEIRIVIFALTMHSIKWLKKKITFLIDLILLS